MTAETGSMDLPGERILIIDDESLVHGLKVITMLHAEQPDLPLVVVSGRGVLSDAIEAIRRGAWDYVTKPIEDMGELALVIKRVLEKTRLRQERDRYRRELEELNRSLEAEVTRQPHKLAQANAELERSMGLPGCEAYLWRCWPIRA